MKINELLEMYKKNQMIHLKNVLEVEEYISTPLKRKMCDLVLDSCIEDVNGVLHIDSFDRYILFTIAVISMHTNLEFSIDADGVTSIDEYDELNKIGLIDKIINTFKTDYEACKVMLDMLTNDRMKNQETLEKKIIQFLNGVAQDIDSLNNLENKEDILNLLESLTAK